MKKLLALLIGILTALPSAYGKDYTFECSYKTRSYLATELGISTRRNQANQEIAQAFLNHYNRTNLRHNILINNDGDVSFDGSDMSVSQAIDRIESMQTTGEHTIVLFIMATYQKKSEKALEKLMKSVYQLIEYREKVGIDYNVYPVLCTNISMGQEVWALKKASTPPVVTPSTTEKIEPEIQTESQPTEKETPQPTTQPEVKSHNVVAEKPTQDTEVSTIPALGEYTVRVNSSLSIRATPSAKGKKIDTLTNGQRVQVIDISNGWAKIWYMDQACYVKADYLEKVEPSDSGTHNYSFGLMHSVYKVLYEYMPYVILLLAILVLLMNENHMKILLFLLGLAELLFAAANSEISIGAVPWFCEPNKVGWIMTSVNYLLLCGVLILHHSAYQGLMGSFRLGCFAYMLSYPLMAAVGIALCSCLVDISYFWAPIVAIGLIWAVAKWKLGYDTIEALRVSFWVSIAFGGLLVFFLQTSGLVIIGGLILVLIRAFAEGKSTSSSSSEDSGSNHSDGTIEHSANGVPFVRHRDGTTTQLHDSGGGVMRDSKGRIWD